MSSKYNPIHLKLVESQLEAYNNRDLVKFLECFHDEVAVYRLNTNEQVSSGFEVFGSNYKRLFDNNPELHCELKSRVVVTDLIVDEEYITGRAAYPNNIHAFAVCGFRDNKIDRVWFGR
ncbi:MAG: nuclear transport factor 2 family protein [Pseudobdellovibrio sp.]